MFSNNNRRINIEVAENGFVVNVFHPPEPTKDMSIEDQARMVFKELNKAHQEEVLGVSEDTSPEPKKRKTHETLVFSSYDELQIYLDLELNTN